MRSSPTAIPPPTPTSSIHPVVRAGMILAVLAVFLLGVNCLGDGFKMLGRGLLDGFFRATSNPFVGLMVGILATTLVQSSSVTTSLVVGMVAAPENPLPIAYAVPIIMGANIGTTVTNSIVSLAHMGRREEFRRAFAVATCHDFFNYITVLILLPLELATGYLRRGGIALASLVEHLGGSRYDSPIKGLLKAGTGSIEAAVAFVFPGHEARAVALILTSAVLIFASLLMLVRLLRSAMRARMERFVSRALGENALLAMVVGIIATIMVQSSSITTSLLVPLAGAGVLTLRQAFPVTIGANIGTTVTALLAALAVTGEHAAAGLTIALVHLLFNLTGTLIVYPLPWIRAIPLRASQWLADTAVVSRPWAIGYVSAMFYGVPALFALLFR